MTLSDRDKKCKNKSHLLARSLTDDKVISKIPNLLATKLQSLSIAWTLLPIRQFYFSIESDKTCKNSPIWDNDG